MYLNFGTLRRRGSGILGEELLVSIFTLSFCSHFLFYFFLLTHFPSPFPFFLHQSHGRIELVLQEEGRLMSRPTLRAVAEYVQKKKMSKANWGEVKKLFSLPAGNSTFPLVFVFLSFFRSSLSLLF
jgi:hypothetical protein